MNLLYKENIKYFVIHTAESNSICNADTITNWHLERGFETIGYHFVIKEKFNDVTDSLLEYGRPLKYAGAHAFGINQKSIGVCLCGNGDINYPTTYQWNYVYALFYIFKNVIPNLKLIGHREINYLDILNKFFTYKTCPGKTVDLDIIRSKTNDQKQNTITQILTNIDPILYTLNTLVSDGSIFSYKSGINMEGLK